MVLLAGLAVAAEPTLGSAFPKGKLGSRSSYSRTQVDSVSPEFMPMRLRCTNPAQSQKLRNILSSFPQDSITFFEEKNGRFEFSHEMVERLSSLHGTSPRGSHWKGWRGQFAQSLSQWSGLKVEAGGPARASYTPNDPWLQGSPQWALLNPGLTLDSIPGKVGYDIKILPVWDQFGGADSLVIAVIDAGFNFKHPDLQGRWWVNSAEARGLPDIDDDANGWVDDSTGWDFVEGDPDPTDLNGHGTEVSSIIVANFDNGIGISGMLPQAKVLPIRVLDASGHGDLGDIVEGIRYAVEMGADVINFSIGGSADSPALKSAFQAARNAGVIIVVAAGNEGQFLDVNTPAPFNYGFDNVISVAAVNSGGFFSKFSNYGPITVDLAAPGEMVLACGVVDRADLWQEDFEGGLAAWTPSVAGDFALTTTNPLEGKQSVEWKSGSNTSLVTADWIDSRGRRGAILWLRVQFTPANLYDALVLEGQREGETRWRPVGTIGGGKIDQGLTFGLTGLDGYRFKLRLRTSSNTVSTTGRKLRLDHLYMSTLDPNPKDTATYPVVAGTSIAAPHVTAYVALLKLACQRLGVPLTKDLILAGTRPDSACLGKTRTGGILDVQRGLAFYLNTLPNLQIVDSTASWSVGQKIQFSLRLSDNQTQGWNFDVGTLPEGGAFDAATGQLTWANGIPNAGNYPLRLKAYGPLVLRKNFLLTVSNPLPVPLVQIQRMPRHRVMTLPLRGARHLNILGQSHEGPQFPKRISPIPALDLPGNPTGG